MKRDRSFITFLVSASLMAFLAFGVLRAQKIPGLGAVKKKLETFSLSRLLKEDPAISTSLDDAVTEVPFLDDFNPPEPSPMTVLPRAKSGNFVLVRPGVFEFKAASYCLRAGTYAPAQGDGYLYAPLKGKRAEIVRHVLEKSVFRPDIPQHDIQYLLWAIVAKTNFTKMARQNQLTAAKLLTPAEIAALSGVSLDAVPAAVLEKAMSEAGLPAPVRAVLRAESKIRDMMTRADTSYADLEKVAVLTGAHLPGDGSREVPSGRWSFHPNGHFIRYFPHGYRTTDIEISVPGPIKVERDPAGRITAISDDGESRIEFIYGPAGAAPTASSGGSLKAHAFKSVRYSGVHPWRLDQKVEGSWTGAGWTLAGFPAGAAVPQAVSTTSPDSKSRLEKARDLKKCMMGLAKASRNPSGFLPPERESLCLEIGSLSDGLREVLAAAGDLDKRPGNDAYAFVKRAWQSALAGLAGPGAGAAGSTGYRSWPGEAPSLLATDLIIERPGHGPSLSFLPGEAGQSGSGGGGEQGGSEGSSGTATPGNTGSQRLGESARPADAGCQAAVNFVSGDVKINGEPASVQTISGSDLEGGTISTGKKGRVEVVLPDGAVLRLGSKSSVTLPQGMCQEAKANQESRKVMQILMDAGFIYARPAPVEPFEIRTGNAVDGVRGDLRRLIHGPGDRIFLASLGGPTPEAITEAEVEAAYTEMRPSLVELAACDVAYFIGCERDVYYYVRVDRGTVVVGDSKGGSVTLKAGEHLFMPLAPAPTPSARKDLFVRTAKGK
jgi:hypothetical protein